MFDSYWDVSETGYRVLRAVKGPGNIWLAEDLPGARDAASAELQELRRTIPKNVSTKNYDPFEQVITDDISLGQTRMVLRYNPLSRDHSALYQIFANTDPTPEGIVKFANNYGLLGEKIFALNTNEGPLNSAERLGLWIKEINDIREAFRFWEKINASDTKGLSQNIRWNNSRDDVSFVNDNGGYLIAHSESLKTMPFVYPDIIFPAKLHLLRVINEHLKGRVSPRLYFNRDYRNQDLYFVPDNLIGALWLQFAQAVEGNKEYFHCKQCGLVFEIDPDTGFRTNKRYCSASCRNKALRKRQQKALSLHKEGIKPAAIAKAISEQFDTKTTAATVKNWLDVK